MSLKIDRNFFQRFDIKLTTYYTGICLSLFIGIYIFFYFSLEHNLTGQIDSVLKDETHELIQKLNETILEGLPIKSGCERFMDDVSGSVRLVGVHEVTVGHAFELGEISGVSMPKDVLIFAIEGSDMRTIAEQLTPEVAAAIEPLANDIVKLVTAE